MGRGPPIVFAGLVDLSQRSETTTSAHSVAERRTTMARTGNEERRSMSCESPARVPLTFVFNFISIRQLWEMTLGLYTTSQISMRRDEKNNVERDESRRRSSTKTKSISSIFLHQCLWGRTNVDNNLNIRDEAVRGREKFRSTYCYRKFRLRVRSIEQR